MVYVIRSAKRDEEPKIIEGMCMKKKLAVLAAIHCLDLRFQGPYLGQLKIRWMVGGR